MSVDPHHYSTTTYSHCPRCGEPLSASSSGSCPNCNWPGERPKRSGYPADQDELDHGRAIGTVHPAIHDKLREIEGRIDQLETIQNELLSSMKRRAEKSKT